MATAETRERSRGIALVEDHTELLSVYEVVLRSRGWPMVFSGMRGEDLIEAVKNRDARPEVVIMDYRLPGIDGVDAARRVRRMLPKVRVVITTADDRVKAEAEDAGLLFIQKPFTIASLLEFLSRI